MKISAADKVFLNIQVILLSHYLSNILDGADISQLPHLVLRLCVCTCTCAWQRRWEWTLRSAHDSVTFFGVGFTVKCTWYQLDILFMSLSLSGLFISPAGFKNMIVALTFTHDRLYCARTSIVVHLYMNTLPGALQARPVRHDIRKLTVHASQLDKSGCKWPPLSVICWYPRTGVSVTVSPQVIDGWFHSHLLPSHQSHLSVHQWTQMKIN